MNKKVASGRKMYPISVLLSLLVLVPASATYAQSEQKEEPAAPEEQEPVGEVQQPVVFSLVCAIISQIVNMVQNSECEHPCDPHKFSYGLCKADIVNCKKSVAARDWGSVCPKLILLPP